jgi:WXG100 family type VII secretion target
VADPEQLSALVEAATAVDERIDERLAWVDREVAALGGCFEGVTAVTHRAKHEVWMTAARDMHAALAELKANVERAQDSYVGTVEHNVRMWP